MKTQEEINSIKEEVEAVGKKLNELTDEELEQVVGGRTMSSQAAKALLALGSVGMFAKVAEFCK